MKRGAPRRALAVLGALVLALAAGEVVARLATETDASGQGWLGSLRLLPYRLPLDRIRDNLAHLQAGDTFLAYDPDLGWSPRRSARSTNGPFRVNVDSIRAEREFARVKPKGTLRIALFGDSFTFGDEVGPEETWAAALERALVERGVAAEVLNFGVSAYGIDQALLRWRRDGRPFRPDVVVLGLQPENVLRNRNVFRPLYFAGTEVPLSKPRFVLRAGADAAGTSTTGDDALALENSPTLPPGDIADALASMPRHPLFAIEGFYAPFHTDSPWNASRLVALLRTMTVGHAASTFRLDDEGRALAAHLIHTFAGEAAADGAAFLVVELPRKEDLAERHAGRDPWYAPLVREDLRDLLVVDPTAGVVPEDALFAPRGHYAAALNDRIGAALAEPVLRAAAGRGAPAGGATTAEKSAAGAGSALPH